MAIAPSTFLELKRTIDGAMAFGPAAGLASAVRSRAIASLRVYHLFPRVRADVLAKHGREEEARLQLERAGALTDRAPDRALSPVRAATCR